MHREGVRMIFIDTASSNTRALKFFKRMGYGRPEAEVWMSKLIQKTRKGKKAANAAVEARLGYAPVCEKKELTGWGE